MSGRDLRSRDWAHVNSLLLSGKVGGEVICIRDSLTRSFNLACNWTGTAPNGFFPLSNLGGLSFEVFWTRATGVFLCLVFC